jgi:uncharacterized membrane protein
MAALVFSPKNDHIIENWRKAGYIEQPTEEKLDDAIKRYRADFGYDDMDFEKIVVLAYTAIKEAKEKSK